MNVLRLILRCLAIKHKNFAEVQLQLLLLSSLKNNVRISSVSLKLNSYPNFYANILRLIQNIKALKCYFQVAFINIVIFYSNFPFSCKFL